MKIMKIMKIKYIVIVIVLLSIGLTLTLVIETRGASIVNNKNKENELTLKIDNKVVYDNFTTKITDINQLIDKNINGYIYFGRDTCPKCLDFNNILEKEYSINKDLLIYKFDTDYWRKDKNFKNVLEQYNISSVPILIKFKDGQIKKTLDIDFDKKNVEEIQKELSSF